MATRRANPVLASQTEKAKRIRGLEDELSESSVNVHAVRPMKRDSIIPSRHSKADRRCVRVKASPAKPIIKADEKINWVGDTGLLQILTVSF